MAFSLCPVKPGPSTGQMGEGRRHSALGPRLGQRPAPPRWHPPLGLHANPHPPAVCPAGWPSPNTQWPCPQGPASHTQLWHPHAPSASSAFLCSLLFPRMEFITRSLPSLGVTSPILQSGMQGCLSARGCRTHRANIRWPHLCRGAHRCRGVSRKPQPR